MMRGQALLAVAFLIVMAVVALTVFLLKTLTNLPGLLVFCIAALVATFTFGVYTLIVVKLGY